MTTPEPPSSVAAVVGRPRHRGKRWPGVFNHSRSPKVIARVLITVLGTGAHRWCRNLHTGEAVIFQPPMLTLCHGRGLPLVMASTWPGCWLSHERKPPSRADDNARTAAGRRQRPHIDYSPRFSPVAKCRGLEAAQFAELQGDARSFRRHTRIGFRMIRRDTTAPSEYLAGRYAPPSSFYRHRRKDYLSAAFRPPGINISAPMPCLRYARILWNRPTMG